MHQNKLEGGPGREPFKCIVRVKKSRVFLLDLVKKNVLLKVLLFFLCFVLIEDFVSVIADDALVPSTKLLS